MKDFYEICSCGNYMEKGEECCQSCHTYNSIELDSTEEYYDELLSEEVISERGVDGIEGVCISKL